MKNIFLTAYAYLVLFVPYVLYAKVSGDGGSSARVGGDGGGNVENTLQNPIGGAGTFGDLINLILDAVIVIGLPIAALFIIYAGFLFVTAQGNEKKVTKAKSTFLWTIVGVAIFLGARVLGEIIQNTVEVLK